MYSQIQKKVREKFVQAVFETFGLRVAEFALGYPPSVEMGEISVAACFELAKQLRQSPRKIADQLAAQLVPLEGVERVSAAGAGYLNFHLDRGVVASALLRARSGGSPAGTPREPVLQGAPLPAEDRLASYPKILVEHTSINPNKAAHIGHLRNAVLGDTFVRLLRAGGHRVEVQNYIDNTGVQVADVVVGFAHLEKKSAAEVRSLLEDSSIRFDYYCWDLYARVFQHYQENKDALALRSEVLQAIEESRGDLAQMAQVISTAITTRHLETLQRVNVRYDLLVLESEILRLDFWKYAFELLKRHGAVHYEDSGKNQGCWVMKLGESGSRASVEKVKEEELGQEVAAEDVKIIVRSNGTVTYVGKDIAYHLWKFGLLEKDFEYDVYYIYPDSQPIWRTSMPSNAGEPQPISRRAPDFGRASAAYAVIDTRQAYLQNVVASAFRALGFREQAANLHHFAYEVVSLTPRCAEEMGVELDAEDRQKNAIEVSGRKGLGVKADDLIDRLIEKALEEVRARELTRDPREQAAYARMIAVGALRYFLLKFSRQIMIAFDFKDALAFEGETGPYLQYTVVRARNIFRKFQETHPQFKPEQLAELVSADDLKKFLADPGGRDFWELTLVAAQLEMTIEQAIAAQEPAVAAKYAFRLAQAFNNFYHHHHILSEPDPARKNFLLFLAHLASETLARTLDLLGIEIPERM